MKTRQVLTCLTRCPDCTVSIVLHVAGHLQCGPTCSTLLPSMHGSFLRRKRIARYLEEISFCSSSMTCVKLIMWLLFHLFSRLLPFSQIHSSARSATFQVAATIRLQSANSAQNQHVENVIRDNPYISLLVKVVRLCDYYMCCFLINNMEL